MTILDFPPAGGAAEPVTVRRPARQTLPVVFASPHSGRDYRADFQAGVRLDPLTLRQSEDCYVDRIFAAVVAGGAPLIAAEFPRAYIDPNREPFELDPDMFADALPDYVNTASPRVAAGLGTIARVVSTGNEIYRRKLRFAEALERINRCYRPYHRQLTELVEATRSQFGMCLLIDCHSMPSVGGPMDRDSGRRRVDVILGDCHGVACDAGLVAHVEQFFEALRYGVRRNLPYAGGFTTRHYGTPRAGVHGLQIELNRGLYLDEATLDPRPYMATLSQQIGTLTDHLARFDWSRLSLSAAAQ
ncbi:MAG: N-formylglutamate amidohydrolase [Alphaproteobacteria bacterium]